MRARPARRAGLPAGGASRTDASRTDPSRTDASAVSADRIGRFIAATFFCCALAAFPGSALFGLRAVAVRGNAAVPAPEIVRRAGIAPGESAFHVNAASIRERVLRDPRIQDVQVAMEFPRRVTIVVRERPPAAALRVPGAYTLLGADGVVIGRVASPPPGLSLLEVDRVDLPWMQPGTVVPSADVRLGARVAGMLPPSLRGKVAAVRVGAGDVVLAMRDGVAVRLGGGPGLADRLQALPGILAAVEERGQRVEYVDVRFAGSVVVRPLAQAGSPGGAAPPSKSAPGPLPPGPGPLSTRPGPLPAGGARPPGQQENPQGR